MINKNGITIISLVITIIVLIILAGVSINLILGQDGIITKAKQAKENIEFAQLEEQETLNELYSEISKEGSGAISYDAIAKLVEFKKAIAQAITEAGINTNTDASKETMAENIKQLPSKTSNTVNYITLTSGDKVPIPKDFYYVGGSLQTGVVISDNKNDNNKYANDEDGNIPSDLEGNQFVWIPCTEEEYVKTDWGTTYQDANSNKTIHPSELLQIKEYGGFYVGRYEAGLADTITEYTTTQNNTSKIYDVEGIPQSKAGLIPWTFISWTNAKKNAESMYNNDEIYSGLMEGTQWDVIINKINAITGNSLTDSSGWGNYYNSEFQYTGRYAKYNADGTTLSIVSNEIQIDATKNKNTRILLTTASNETIAKVYNLYDIAGNVWEYTEEISTKATSGQYRMSRGGSCYNPSSTYPACYRHGDYGVSYTLGNIGFRVVLYMK